MKHRAFSGVVLVTVLCVASLVFAGDWHSGTNLVCSDCHVMHFSQTHAYDGGSNPNLGSGPNDYLLRDTASNLCLSCHDGQFTYVPDVMGANTNAGYLRQGGALNVPGGVDGYLETDGHSIGYDGAIPGNVLTISAANPLTCTHCHSAHGSGTVLGASGYRNLGGFGTGVDPGVDLDQISYLSGIGNNLNTVWVFEDFSFGTLADHYGQDKITFNEPGAEDGNSYGNFCAGCHGDFHGDPGDANIGAGASGPFIRHPVAGVDIGALVADGSHSDLTELTGKTNQVHVMSPGLQKAGSYDGTDTGLTPSCMTCHKGHGNQNAYGLIYMSGGGTLSEEGDGGVYRDLCKQCHVQGG
jgi:predicted CXXCH cytochrome family protein